ELGGGRPGRDGEDGAPLDGFDGEGAGFRARQGYARWVREGDLEHGAEGERGDRGDKELGAEIGAVLEEVCGVQVGDAEAEAGDLGEVEEREQGERGEEDEGE